MEAQQNKKLEATTSNRKDFACQVVPFIQVTDLEKLMRENAFLKRQLRDAHAKQCESDNGIAAAERAIASLRHQLLNSENKVASLKLKMDMAKCNFIKSLVCLSCSKKDDRQSPPLTSLAQTLVVNGKCWPAST